MFEVRKRHLVSTGLALFGVTALTLFPQQGFGQMNPAPTSSPTGSPISTPIESPSPTATPTSVPTPGGQVKLETIHLGGVGTITYGTTGCESDPGTCDLSGSGTLGNKNKGGSFQTNLSVQWSTAVPNGSGGLCAPAAGTIQFAPNHNTSVSATLVGSYCETGASAPGVSHVLKATYWVTEGQQNKSTIGQGVGEVSAGDDGAGNLAIDIVGTLGFTK
jgi:hypothetical protein